ncbi:hypothetical protein C5689_01585 [Methylosinus sporium]|uniref:Uncharacterized protein n=1 Tax=Methylosinus sporium TaxID=428 RepID=A0A2U1SW36_METSR|nr:hypothetical protein C5689_01585 [Methylosinus sporium]
MERILIDRTESFDRNALYRRRGVARETFLEAIPTSPIRARSIVFSLPARSCVVMLRAGMIRASPRVAARSRPLQKARFAAFPDVGARTESCEPEQALRN